MSDDYRIGALTDGAFALRYCAERLEGMTREIDEDERAMAARYRQGAAVLLGIVNEIKYGEPVRPTDVRV